MLTETKIKLVTGLFYTACAFTGFALATCCASLEKKPEPPAPIISAPDHDLKLRTRALIAEVEAAIKNLEKAVKEARDDS